MRTLISNPTIVNNGEQFRGSIIIENDIIAEIIRGEKTPQGNFDNIIDAKGMFLIPGVIDDHVHFREPGLTEKATIASESRAAAAGGVTSFMEMPNNYCHRKPRIGHLNSLTLLHLRPCHLKCNKIRPADNLHNKLIYTIQRLS